jgi:hypothetical protein
MAIGIGPGVYLINPDPASTDPPPTLLGIPILYAWALIWCTVLAGIVALANYFIWSREGDS